MAAQTQPPLLELRITATFTAEPIAEALTFWLAEMGFAGQMAFAPYGQVFQELLNPGSLLSTNHSGMNVVLVRLEDWYRSGSAERTEEERRGALARNAVDLAAAVDEMAGRSGQPLILCLCPASPDFLADEDRACFVTATEHALAAQLSGAASVCVFTSADVLAAAAVEEYFDAQADQLGHIPYTPDFFFGLATVVARRIFSLTSAPYKVIVVDCDDTLWSGGVAEVGADRVELDAGRCVLQRFLVEQYRGGRLLALCSKNVEEDVLAVFERRHEFPLQLEHMIGWRINWEDKSANLRALARDLDLGLDSFIFVDDNPLECAEVRAACPEVLVLQLPGDPTEIPGWLRRIWAFDHVGSSAEDQRRTELYRRNLERQEALREAPTLGAFISGLALEVRFDGLTADNRERAAQLTQRTNQFNLAAIRRQAPDLERLTHSGELEARIIAVSDRFGDYGTVGVLLFAVNADHLEVDTFLLSCRVLGRGVEHRMLRYLGELAAARGLRSVVLPYVATPRSQPARAFLESIPGALRQETGIGARYVVGTDAAARAAYDPRSERPPVSDPESATASPTAHGAVRNALMHRLASELARPEALRNAVEEWARRRAAASLQPGESYPYSPPRGAAEAALVRILEEVLRRRPVGVHDNFFDLGGDSLLATQVASRIRKRLGVEVSLGLLFEKPTVADLAGALAGSDPAIAFPLELVSRGRPLALSLAQERLLFVQELEPESTAYNVPDAHWLTGPLDVDVLRYAVNIVVERHEPLRTSFVSVDGEPAQVIAPAAALDLRIDDGAATPPAQREAAAMAWLQRETETPFDLARGPLLRVALLRFSTEEHLLLINMHHIISDGWSMDVFRREVSEVYAARVSGRAPVLPDLSVHYADYAHWQRRLLRGAASEDRLEYWRKQLRDAPELIELPADRPRPEVRSQRGSTVPFHVPAALTMRAKELSRQEGVTLFQLTLAVFQVLLARYSGCSDVVVGSPVAGRTRTELEPLIGFFVNTLLLRSQVGGEMSFKALLARVRETTLAAFQHQEVPFERLVELLQPQRTLAHSPLFQAMFVLNSSTDEPLQLGGLDIRRIEPLRTVSKFDLTLSLSEREHALSGSLTYSTDLFDAATAERLLESFRSLLESAVASPDRRVGDLALLTRAERSRLLLHWNDTAAPVPADRCFHELFEAQVWQSPEAVAVVCEGEQLTYRELNERAHQLARQLRRSGVGPDVLVGIYLRRSVEMVVALLGVMKAGGAYVPLDSSLPPKRLDFTLKDARLTHVVTDRSLTPPFADASVTLIRLDPEGTLRAEPIDDADPGAGPANLAYVIYTSGSTGEPKGVGIEHRQLVNYVVGLRRRLGLVSGASYATVSTLAADLGNTVIFSALASGGCLHVITEERIFHGDRLADYFRRHRIDCLKITPSHLAALQDINDPAALLPRRWLVLGGEAAPLAWVDRLSALAPDCQIFNHYGPTETTIGALTFSFDATRPTTRSSTLVLGRPLPNVQVFVVDADLHPVPVGVPGELLIGGSCVGRGYLNRPDLTAQRFIENPFGPGRVYRTGDRCRYLADGNVEFLGRLDDQVKIRGFRVEPGEIEAVLRRHPAVRECAIVLSRDHAAGARLIAFVAGDRLSAADMRSYLKLSLPEYMLPSVLVQLRRLPLTPNGKVDRRALVTMEGTAAAMEAKAERLPPRDEVEVRLIRLWQDLLGVDGIGIRDDFFDLGGNSLHALRLFARIRREFGVDLPLVSLFEAPTIEASAALIRSSSADRRSLLRSGRVESPLVPHPSRTAPRHLVGIQPHGSRPPFFCVHGVGGDVLILRELARTVGSEQPFYAVQARGLDGARAPAWSVEEMAGAYLDEIRALQPDGPYFIGGYSGGGVIAFEMAQQLIARGADLGLLVLIDTIHPSVRSRQTSHQRAATRIRRFDLLREQGAPYIARWARARLRWETTRLRFFQRKLKLRIYDLLNITLPHELRYAPVAESQQRAVQRYLFRRLPARITLFASSDAPGPRTVVLPPLGWAEWADGGVETIQVPGSHQGMLRLPHVTVLASELRVRIDHELARRAPALSVAG